ncbi:hypothetical protein [uncultured Carboxylicivirga sp.]|uniref:hypothetical protein n=1 Tax=uncultured Carboxylicivirga sp. TaxID=1628156 RepID=UPI0011781068|nr:hypothetical protein [uncultured Carboxylicivirga sp.]TRX66395.1 hypothetical protein FNN09_13595 [Carboxylicivirga sp. M1479]
MDLLVRYLGQFLFRLNQAFSRLLYFRILQNHTSIVIFILLTSFIISFIAYWATGFSYYDALMYSVVVEVGLFLLLLIIGASYEVQRLKKSRCDYSFRFVRSNLNGIEISDLGFSEMDRSNLALVLNNLRPKQKIDFKLVSDNRIAADYKQLLRILYLLIDGGINEYSKEQKDQLFTFIQDTFTLNGLDVNLASLRSRYSEWINEKEDEFEVKLKAFRNILFQ